MFKFRASKVSVEVLEKMEEILSREELGKSDNLEKLAILGIWDPRVSVVNLGWMDKEEAKVSKVILG